MNKYYHRGNGEVVAPTIEQPDKNHFYEPDYEEANRLYYDSDSFLRDGKKFDQHIISLPVYATIDFDAPVDWLDGVREQKQTLLSYGMGSTWYNDEEIDIKNFDFDVLDKAPRRILIVKEDSPNKKPIQQKYRCLLCDRDKFDKPTPHNCVGGYRKRGLKWQKFYSSTEDFSIFFEAINLLTEEEKKYIDDSLEAATVREDSSEGEAAKVTIEQMNRAVWCLITELPAPVYDHFSNMWKSFTATLPPEQAEKGETQEFDFINERGGEIPESTRQKVKSEMDKIEEKNQEVLWEEVEEETKMMSVAEFTEYLKQNYHITKLKQ